MKILTAICLSLIGSFIAGAQTPELLHSFTNSGGNPNAPLAEGPDGALYGTTVEGNGSVFRITGSGEFTVVGNFNRTNGRNPDGSALTLAPDLNFYSTTVYGGSGDIGVVFRISTNGGLTKLIDFTGDNGFNPSSGGITLGNDGDLYGLTASFNYFSYFGTAYKITTAGAMTVLARFTNSSYPLIPAGHLTLAPDGNFYGANYGRIFRMTPGGVFTTVTNLPMKISISGFTLGNDGLFYGLAPETDASPSGAIFRVATNGAFAVLTNFTGPNGQMPSSRMALAEDGTFYGTTVHGGDFGEGTIFHVTPDGRLTTLFSFSRTTQTGFGAYGGLIFASDGWIYGTTMFGGVGGGGAIFRLARPPEILEQPSNRTNDIGTLATFSVNAIGSQLLEYQWLKNGQPIADGGNVSGAATSTLSLANVQPNDAGEFSVIVSNSAGSVISLAAILTLFVVDSDGDGVPDDIDLCPGSPARSVVDEHGCSIDQLVPCDGPITGGTWKNHGQYLTAFTAVANSFFAKGLITAEQWRALIQTATHSQCGKR
jgi:uncharacterized repeat protein (TIGR03803 family)